MWAELKLDVDSRAEKNFEETKLFRKIREDGIKYERPLLLQTLIAMASGEINVYEENLIDRDGNAIQKDGLCLDEKVQQILKL